MPLLNLSHSEDSLKHRFHDAAIQRGGGKPQVAAGNTAAIGLEVERVAALLHQLPTEWKERND